VKIGIASVGVVVGGAASETRLGAAFPDAPEALRALPVRPAPPELGTYFRAPPERLARTDRLCRLSLAAVEVARGTGEAPKPPVAVVHESGLATIGTNDGFFQKLLRRGPRGVDPKRFPYTSPNAVAGEIAIAHGFGGPNLAMLAGMTGGLGALATAVGLLRHGRAASAVVVGADVISVASVAWLAATGQGIGSAGEGAIALVLTTEGRALGTVDSTSDGLDPEAGRAIRTDPADAALADAGDLPGAVGLLAIVRALEAGRGASVRVSGPDGVFAEAVVSAAK